MEGGYLLSSVLVQGLYQLICSAALPQNLSGSATEAAKWVLYSPPLPVVRTLQLRPPRPATKALRAAPAPLAEGDPGRGAPRVPAPVTLRYCSQEGFILSLCSQWQAHQPARQTAEALPSSEAGTNSQLSPKPISLEVKLKSQIKTDLEPLGKQQAGAETWGKGAGVYSS